MNHHYRIIFNRARGQCMVVAETTKSHVKGGGAESVCASRGGLASSLTPNWMHKLRPITASVLSALLLVQSLAPAGLAHAQIVADPTAAGQNRPTVLAAPNGVPVVNIQTPSAAGVSRNIYSRFDVDRQGAILNNSRSNVQSQLGGWVQGNPWLARGEARVILNEVNSSNPSHLKGYVEVAGQRAELVIANPAGIAVDGAGFINAGRVTLSTGQAQLDANGGLQSHRIHTGAIRVQGQGLDAGATDYTALLARAVEANAGIWARELGVITGENTVTAQAGQNGRADIIGSSAAATPSAPTTSSPSFALDVGHLGGMYAGKITLIGTEAGVGVRNAGSIVGGTTGAAAGQVHIDANGKLTNTGVLGSNGSNARTDGVAIHTHGQGIHNSGTISSAGDLQLQQAGDLHNSGTIHARRELQAQTAQLHNTGDITAARLDMDAQNLRNREGRIRQTGAQSLSIEAASVRNAAANGQDGILGAEAAGTTSTASPSTPVTPPATSGGSQPANPATTGTAGTGAVVQSIADVPEALANGRIRVADSIDNAGGHITANGATELTTTRSLVNSSAIRVSRVQARGELDNQGGSLTAQSVDMDVGTLGNQKGHIHGQQDAVLKTRRLDNTQGAITTGGALMAQVEQELNNRQGTIAAAGTLDAQAAGTLDNTAGTLAAKQARLQAASINNTGGTIAADTLQLSSRQELHNTGGQVLAKDSLILHSGGELRNDAQGRIEAEGAVSITAAGLYNLAGSHIGSHGHIHMDAASVTNANSTIAADTLQLSSRQELHNTGGQVLAQERMELQTGGPLRNVAGGQIAGGGPLHITAAGVMENLGGSRIGSNEQADIQAAGIHNDASLLYGHKLNLQTHGQDIINSAGNHANGPTNAGIVAADELTITTAHAGATHGTLDNRTGRIASGGVQRMAAGRIDNRSGTLASDADMQLQALGTDALEPVINNSQAGQISARGNITLETTGVVSNQAGHMAAGGDLHIHNPALLFNHAGNITAGSTLRIEGSGKIHNDQGSLYAQRLLQLSAASLLAGTGRIESGGDMHIRLLEQATHTASGTWAANGTLGVDAAGELHNHGTITGGTSVAVQADTIHNTATGSITSAGHTRVQANNALHNRGLIDGHITHVQAPTLNNIGTGRIYGDRLAIAAGTVNNLAENVDGTTRSATIAAREQLDMGVQALYNQGGSTILSLGSIAISGALDGQGQANPMQGAGSIHNHGSTIEAGRNLALHANTITNSNAGLVINPQVAVGSTALPAKIWPEKGTQWEDAGLFHEDPIKGVLVRPIYPDKYDPKRPPAYRPGDSSCLENPRNGISCIPIPEYLEPRNSPRFAEFGIKPPPAQAIELPDPADYGGRVTGRQDFSSSGSSVGIGNSGDNDRDPLFGFDRSQTGANDTALKPVRPQRQTLRIMWLPGSRQAEYEAALKAYDEDQKAYYDAIDALVDAMEKVNQTETWRNYKLLENGVQTTAEDRVVASDPGRITAGGHMQLAGNVTNHDSAIIAGGDIQHTGGGLNNIASQGTRIVTTTGELYQIGWRYSNWSGRQKRNKDALPRHYEESHTTFALPTTVYQAYATLANPAGVANNGAGGAPVAGGGATLPGANSIPAVTEISLPNQQANLPTVARTLSPVAQLPASSLYIVNPANGNAPLIELDPRFANYRQWLSSDYMLSALGLEGERLQKRLGDGYYEQQLVQEQIIQLTGRRWLGDHRSDDEQYKALMNAGITFAQTHAIRPGIALSDAQIAQLTSDIVWLVEQSITLSDGSTHQVLAPRIYTVQPQGGLAAEQSGHSSGSGALISGANLRLNPGENNLINLGGTLAAREQAVIDAHNIHNHAGARIRADQIILAATDAIRMHGGQARAASALIAQAGGDIELQTTTRSSAGGDAANGYSNTVLDQQAGLHVSGHPKNNPESQGLLLLDAGGAIRLQGAHISNQAGNGRTQLQAAGDIELDSIRSERSHRSSRDSKTYLHDSQSRDIGSRLTGAGDIAVAAGHNLRVKASDIDATGDLQLQAGQDIRIEAGQAQTSFSDGFYRRKRNALTGGRSNTFAFSGESSHSVSSNVGGHTVTVASGGDIGIAGSNVISDTGTHLIAAGDMRIADSETQHSSALYRKDKTSGILGNDGISFTFGWRSQSIRSEESGKRSNPSTIASLNGDVIAIAAGNYRQSGSHLIAPAGDIAVQAANIAIEEGRNSIDSHSEQHSKQSGRTVGLSNPILEGMMGIMHTAQSMDDTDNPRMQALGAAVAAWQGYQAVQSMQAIAQDPSQASTVGISVSNGSQSSRSEERYSEQTATPSSLNAAGDISLRALQAQQPQSTDKTETDKAATDSGNIHIRGSHLTAGGDIDIHADRNLELHASQDWHSQSNRSSFGSASIGITYGGGSQNGLSINIGASTARSRGQGSGTSYNPSTVVAGENARISSGADTRLIAAGVHGQRVESYTGGNLTIESLQDSNRYSESSSNAGFKLNLCFYPVCYGVPVTASISAGKSKIRSNYQSVGSQSGLYAGAAGFNVYTEGHTSLIGGVIAGNREAAEQGKNRFSTASLSTQDIANHADYQARGWGATISVSLGKPTSKGDNADNASPTDKGQDTPTQPQAAHRKPESSMGAGSDEASANSTTASGISAGELEIRNEQAQQARTGQTAQEAIAQLNREVDSEQNGSQRLEPIFDKDKVRADIHAQIAITAEFGKAAAKGIGQYASQKQTQAQYKALLAQQSPDGELEGKTAQQWQQEADNWAEGGLWRTALHTAAGAMSGDLPGALGAAAASTAAPWLEKLQDNLQQQLAQSGMDSGSAREIAQTGTGLLATALGAAAGATAGAAAALNTDFNNRALHENESKKLEELKKGKTPQEQKEIDEAVCYRIRCAAGISKNDPNYAKAQSMQEAGAKHTHWQQLTCSPRIVRN